MRDWVDLLLLKAGAVPELLDNVRVNLGSRIITAAAQRDALSDTLAGKLCVVTGANAGVGLDTSAALARRGATVLMACRSLERGQAAVQHVKASLQRLESQSSAGGDGSSGSSRNDNSSGDGGSRIKDGASKHTHPGSVELRQLDLARLSSVREFVRRCPRRPDLLVCNAGLMAPEQRGETPDGLEQQFQVGRAAGRSVDGTTAFRSLCAFGYPLGNTRSAQPAQCLPSGWCCCR
jgi:WW domain-containing oxidoreductase